MKIIDLLNKIANGEEVPKKIKYDGQEWKYNPINDYEGIKYGGCLLNRLTLDGLNDEVEIIEEDKEIEKLDVALLNECDNWTRKYSALKMDYESTDIYLNPYIITNIRKNTLYFQNAINELIDKVNSLENKQ